MVVAASTANPDVWPGWIWVSALVSVRVAVCPPATPPSVVVFSVSAFSTASRETSGRVERHSCTVRVRNGAADVLVTVPARWRRPSTTSARLSVSVTDVSAACAGGATRVSPSSNNRLIRGPRIRRRRGPGRFAVTAPS